MTTKKAKRKNAGDVPATMRDWSGWAIVNKKGWHQSVAFRRVDMAEVVIQSMIQSSPGCRIARVRVTEIRTPTRKAKSTQHKAAKAAGGSA